MKIIITFILVITFSSLFAEAFLGLGSKKNKTETEKETTTKAPKETKPPKQACDSKPCKNKATCKQFKNDTKQFECECTAGYHGQYCELKTKSSICDPNPCDNKAKCQLELKNSLAFKCNCTEGYMGKYCEKTNGCHKNKCKRGACVLDSKDPTNHTCKCEEGYLGSLCDTADPCKKNPCKVGVCKVDQKLKAQCTCPAGFTGTKCDKRDCKLVQVKGKHIEKSSNKVWVHESLEKKFEDIDGLAKLCHVKLHILKSYIPSTSKTNKYDSTEKTNQHHYIGHALKFEIYDENDKLLCNDICLGKIPIPDSKAKCFIDGLNAIKMKWSILDPTVIHTGFATANINEYNNIREEVQVGCKETKF